MSADALDEDARFRALVTALGRTLSDPEAASKLATDPSGWLTSQGLAPEDVEVLAAQGARRLLVYRKLVRSGLEGALRVQLPRTSARLGARLTADVDGFCGTLPRSHFLRDVPREWLAFVRPSWARDPSLPSHLGDLAQHELSGFEICAAAPRLEAPSVDASALDAARPVAFDAAARVYRYDHPVHLVDDDVDVALSPRPTTLLGYRDATHDARYLELSDLAAALAPRLLDGAPLGAAIVAACGEVGLAVDATSLGRVATFLADLAQRKILLGARG